jgi:hypothetical protein
MSKQSKLLIILASAILVLSVGVSLGITLLSKKINSPENKLFGSSVVLENEKAISKVPTSSKEYNVLTFSYNVSKNGEEIGVLYVGKAKNKYGTIDLYVGINYNGKSKTARNNHTFSVEVVGLDQTQDYFSRIEEFVRNSLTNVKVNSYKDIPTSLASGASTPSFSVGSIIELVRKAIVRNYNIVEDPLVDLYGEGAVKGEAVVVNSTISKQDVTGGKGGYILIASGNINTQESGVQAVTLSFAFDSDNKLIGILYDNGYASDDWSKSVLNDFVKANIGVTRSQLTGSLSGSVITSASISGSDLSQIIKNVSEVEL